MREEESLIPPSLARPVTLGLHRRCKGDHSLPSTHLPHSFRRIRPRIIMTLIPPGIWLNLTGYPTRLTNTRRLTCNTQRPLNNFPLTGAREYRLSR